MTDTFYELLIERKKDTASLFIKIGAGLLVLLSLFFSLLQPIFLFIAVAIGAATYFFIFLKLDVEYEYSILNSEINIDIIYAKSRRKRIMTFDAKDIILLAPANSGSLKQYENLKKIDYSARDISEPAYGVIVGANSSTQYLVLQLNEKFISLIRNYNPRSIQAF